MAIGWESPLYTVLEQEGFVEICAVLQGGTASLGGLLPQINVATMDGAAVGGLDYDIITDPRAFSFQSGAPSRMCTNVTIIMDDLLEERESFSVSLTVSTPDPRVILDPAQTHVDILDSNGKFHCLKIRPKGSWQCFLCSCCDRV